MDKMKQWALLTVVAIVAVVVAGWFVLISPQRSHASQVRAQTATQQQQNDQLRAEIASLQAQHKGLPQVQAELAKLGIQLPNNPGLPTLIRSLSSAADAAGVDLVSMSPSQPTAVGAPAATAPGAAAAAAAPSSAGALSSISVAVVVNGGYFQIEQFVSNLEALSRPFLTSAINMVPQKPAHGTSTTTTAVTSATTTQGYDGHLQATISGQIFMVSPAPAPAATSPVTAPTAAPSAPQK